MEQISNSGTIETCFAFVFGLIFGSFANVVIWRLPKRESIVWPGSHCPLCKKPIAWHDNIPLLSWILLRAHCRHCKGTISWRYPLVELLTGIAFTIIVSRFGLSFSTLEYLIFAWGLIVVSFI